MAIVTRKTTPEVAHAIHNGKRTFDFCSTDFNIQAGSILMYDVWYNMKSIPHPIRQDRFVVTYVLKDDPRVRIGTILFGLKKLVQDFE